MANKKDSSSKKSTYHKPELRKLTLRADEVMTKSCKGTPPQAGPGALGCQPLGAKCSNLGS